MAVTAVQVVVVVVLALLLELAELQLLDKVTTADLAVGLTQIHAQAVVVVGQVQLVEMVFLAQLQ
jgi:hypothetical protein